MTGKQAPAPVGREQGWDDRQQVPVLPSSPNQKSHFCTGLKEERSDPGTEGLGRTPSLAMQQQGISKLLQGHIPLTGLCLSKYQSYNKLTIQHLLNLGLLCL